MIIDFIEALDFAVDEGLQIHGGYGYMQDYEIVTLYRDARIKHIFEGTNEINRLFIANTVVKRLMKGQFGDLQERINKVIEKADASWDDSNSEGGLNHEMAFVERVRDIYVFTLAHAIEKYRSNLGEQQEISSNLADILIQLFAMESAVKSEIVPLPPTEGGLI
ncbi:acyl-CoA dehydrogenase family protein [Paenibacillus prosopidis]|uniref:Acyl-CoA dehydrogenase-like protein n=1 Tax=Paenibacillus prosopidis TaxID=630520 RepID=A0A368VK26_9BACL|nr:acyl-CoA dehydrogenase family protein [Paenibacillus prosopidis]RCW40883.1 acyl-CoA dehydrogenase-like protein [Paenibacillus prosopidis]